MLGVSLCPELRPTIVAPSVDLTPKGPCMRILELTQRSDELHAICTGIPYCFASRAVSWLTEMTQVLSHLTR